MENNTMHGMTGNTQSNSNPPLQKANEVANEMKQEVGKYVDTAKERLEKFGDDMKEQGKMAREGLEKAKKYADDYVHENPWTVIGVAAAVGAVVGLLVGGCGSNRKCRHHDE